jgi:hypothetical protein
LSTAWRTTASTAAEWAKILLVTLLVIGAVLQSMGIPEFSQWFVVR